MIARLVAWCAGRPRTVIAAALLAAFAGGLARCGLSRDVLPELADPQIALAVDWMGHPAAEVASRVTKVITGALQDVPGSVAVRGSAMSGMSSVSVVFARIRDLEPGRRTILERLSAVHTLLPPEARVQVGPVAADTGWVFQYALVDPSHAETPTTLRRFQNDVLRPALQAIPGVVEVAAVGGIRDQVLVDVRSEELRARGIPFTDVVATLRRFLRNHDQAGVGDLANLRLETAASPAPPPMREVAQVVLDHDMPAGLADLAGVLPAVGGVVVAGRGADIPALVSSVRRTLEAKRTLLKGGARIVTVYDRSELIARTERILLGALGEEVAVVALVILVFLLHGRSAVVPLATLPLVLLLTFGAMWLLGVPANIMSLGGIGIALGLAVDADVVALEACHRRIEKASPSGAPGERRALLLAAASSFGPAILTSLLIAALSFLPVLAFAGETGRLLRPLALAKTLVIATAALVAVTVAPALRDRLLGGSVVAEFENPLTRTLVRLYRPFVRFALERPVVTLLSASLALLSCAPIVARLGGEFLPRVDEGDLLFMPTSLPGPPPEDLPGQLRAQDRALMEATEVATVFGKAGRAETATDPAPLSMVETIIRLRPRGEWPRVEVQRWYSGWAPPLLRSGLSVLWPEERPRTRAELIDRLDRAARLPGWTNAWTSPARARMDMMATGVRTPVGIRIVARDPARLDELGAAIRTAALRLEGTRSATFESLGGESWLQFEPEPGALAACAVDAGEVRSIADLLITGGQIGEVEREGRRVRVRVAQDVNARGPPDQLRALTVSSRGGAGPPVPLALLGHPVYALRPATLHTEGGELAAYVQIDLSEGSEPLGYVERAQRELEHARAEGELRLDAGERIEWIGQYRLLADGARRLRWIVPVVVLSMLLLLYLQFRSLTEALIILLAVPFALVGSFWTLFLLGYPLSPAVWVGLLSVSGLAMQAGVVMVVYIDDAFYRRLAEGRLATRDDIVAAHAEGTVLRLRPKIMTITTMAAGLLPLLWADGPGGEVMRRVAAPMAGGLTTSAFLTLEVLPVLYTIWRHRQLRLAQRLGVPIATIVGVVPSWATRPAPIPGDR